MTAAVSEAPTGTELVYKDLIDEQLWERLVSRIVKDEHMERPLAERVMNEALGFLQLCSKEPDNSYGPSETVDIGWHTFILYTREYAEFCNRVAGHFIHHAPTDVPGMDYTAEKSGKDTMQAMLAYGPVDEMLWVHAADCNDSCSSSCQSCASR